MDYAQLSKKPILHKKNDFYDIIFLNNMNLIINSQITLMIGIQKIYPANPEKVRNIRVAFTCQKKGNEQSKNIMNSHII